MSYRWITDPLGVEAKSTSSKNPPTAYTGRHLLLHCNPCTPIRKAAKSASGPAPCKTGIDHSADFPAFPSFRVSPGASRLSNRQFSATLRLTCLGISDQLSAIRKYSPGRRSTRKIGLPNRAWQPDRFPMARSIHSAAPEDHGAH